MLFASNLQTHSLSFMGRAEWLLQPMVAEETSISMGACRMGFTKSTLRALGVCVENLTCCAALFRSTLVFFSSLFRVADFVDSPDLDLLL